LYFVFLSATLQEINTIKTEQGKKKIKSEEKKKEETKRKAKKKRKKPNEK